MKSSANDYVVLTELTKISKVFCGYSQNQTDEWEEFLAISEDSIIQNEVYNLILENKIIGYYAYFRASDVKVKLDNIFILPECIGKKYGAYLMDDFISRVKQAGFSIASLNSEPNSEGFYKKLGFSVIGKMDTLIKNRFIPIMEKNYSE